MISLTEVHRHYTGSGREVRAVNGVSLEIAADEFVALTGPSGCGKSTLMHLIAGLDRATAGEIIVGGLALRRANDQELTRFRRERLGLVFQFFNLLPTMTVLENIMFPLLLAGGSREQAEARAHEVMALIGLSERGGHFPRELSGGEQQRTAIARALVHRPALFIADEPTGNLDSAASAAVMRAIHQVAEARMATVLLVTHSEEIALGASRRLRMRDGRVCHDDKVAS